MCLFFAQPCPPAPQKTHVFSVWGRLVFWLDSPNRIFFLSPITITYTPLNQGDECLSLAQNNLGSREGSKGLFPVMSAFFLLRLHGEKKKAKGEGKSGCVCASMSVDVGCDFPLLFFFLLPILLFFSFFFVKNCASSRSSLARRQQARERMYQ
jgi:hypothetical protein